MVIFIGSVGHLSMEGVEVNCIIKITRSSCPAEDYRYKPGDNKRIS